VTVVFGLFDGVALLLSSMLSEICNQHGSDPPLSSAPALTIHNTSKEQTKLEPGNEDGLRLFTVLLDTAIWAR
jgi:hypothetical protein